MKKSILITLIVFSILFNTNIWAQVPPPPPPDHGSTGNQNGGNAPIGSGLLILIGLGVGYGGKKFYDIKNKKAEK